MTDSSDSPTVNHPAMIVRWRGELLFDAGREAQPPIRIDGDAKSAPGPFDSFLAGIASCAAVDVVTILGKQRTPAQSLEVRVEAQRVSGTPRRLAAAVLHFTIRAPGATQLQVERAIELSVNKYCSVRSSVISDAQVRWILTLLT